MQKITDSAKVYNPFTLKLYDWWVLGISNHFAWRCNTIKHLVPHYLKHVRHRHLDIGVGTGFYLTDIPDEYIISLMDLNTASLHAAARRVGKNRVKKAFGMMYLSLFRRNFTISLILFLCSIFYIVFQEQWNKKNMLSKMQ